MQLYKDRNFSAMFQDTFSFLKLNGKHFFKHFFVVNGIFILLLLVIGYFFMKLYTEFLFGSFGNSSVNVMDEFMNENGLLFAFLAILFVVVALISGVISYAYTPIYLQLYEKNGTNDFSSRNIIAAYKEHLGRLIVFLGSIVLLFIPVVIVVVIFMFVLIITIVGIMFTPLLIGGLMLIFTMALMEYLEAKKGIWECYGYSWTLLSSKFWAAIGSVGIFYFMAYLVQNIPSILIYFIGIINMLTDFNNGAMDTIEVKDSMTVLLLAMFVISFLLGVVLNVIVQLNQAVIFYSLKEGKENIKTKSIIDEIGSGV